MTRRQRDNHKELRKVRAQDGHGQTEHPPRTTTIATAWQTFTDAFQAASDTVRQAFEVMKQFSATQNTPHPGAQGINRRARRIQR